jgi:hypothetical protein
MSLIAWFPRFIFSNLLIIFFFVIAIQKKFIRMQDLLFIFISKLVIDDETIKKLEDAANREAEAIIRRMKAEG